MTPKARFLSWNLPFRLTLLLALLSACRPGGPDPIAPEGLVDLDRDSVEAWIAAITPDEPRIITIRPWRYTNDRGTAAGRARVRVVPPDSMRFDFRAPFGKSGAAVIVGREHRWSRPEGDFSALVRVAPVFWSALGNPIPPPPGVSLRGLVLPGLKVWQYGYMGDSLTFIVEGEPVTRMRGEMRRDGSTFAWSNTVFDPQTGQPTESSVDFPWEPSRFTFDVQGIEIPAIIEPDVWNEP